MSAVDPADLQAHARVDRTFVAMGCRSYRSREGSDKASQTNPRSLSADILISFMDVRLPVTNFL